MEKPSNIAVVNDTADSLTFGGTFLQRAVGSCVYVFEGIMPDPFVLVILLTIITAAAALAFAPLGTPSHILIGWYAGITNIFTFAFQMILILVTGYALANAAPIKRGLHRVCALATGPGAALAIVFFGGCIASFLNWGFGLVVGAMLAKEVAKRVRVDFAWLVAASYSAWVLWTFTGMSSSIALSIASPGSPLNFIEKATHTVIPLTQTVFSLWILGPGILAMIGLPLLYMAIRPVDADAKPIDPSQITEDEKLPPVKGRKTLAGRLEHSPLITLAFVAAGIAYLVLRWRQHGVALDINTVIFIFLIAGLLFHGSAGSYVRAISSAATVTGQMMLQYPFYGGIMGIMSATGLAKVISSVFVHLASGWTLPFWSYVGSLIITLFIPSGGGHWAVQGPFTIPAAMRLHASMAATSMGVASGELASSLLQPFWAIPLVAIAGVGVRRVLGFTFASFLLLSVFYGVVYLLIAPAFATY
ncbi:TIGR00366 family protein [Acidiphilium sp. AL]|uniref:TIGR00366 family protein n=1 Tax=Acidiphilium sp. AL TaxID=2871704 RepID=UPI0021CB265B|nr:TIGR00366 family protein [Acidiphilium sp. AL]MCU4161948.1 TIGR00366 family protein [Acidiphilium sp. AL]